MPARAQRSVHGLPSAAASDWCLCASWAVSVRLRSPGCEKVVTSGDEQKLYEANKTRWSEYVAIDKRVQDLSESRLAEIVSVFKVQLEST